MRHRSAVAGSKGRHAETQIEVVNMGEGCVQSARPVDRASADHEGGGGADHEILQQLCESNLPAPWNRGKSKVMALTINHP